jgi:formylglycine-generating enzyme required for sulfatase activity
MPTPQPASPPSSQGSAGPVAPSPAPQPPASESLEDALRRFGQPAPAPPQSSGYPVPIRGTFRDCATCPEMVVIEPGRFTMGSPRSEDGHDPDEGPQRDVTLATPLAIGKFEVTYAEWDACFNDTISERCRYRPPNDSSLQPNGRLPVGRVSWDDTQQYLRWLNAKTGRRYRLLTEAEFEYVARAGTCPPGRAATGACPPFGDLGMNITPNQANFQASGLRRKQPVGTYKPNYFGAHDMLGNQSEWVEDCYRENFNEAPPNASQAVRSNNCSARVLRGGSFDSPRNQLRAAFRQGNDPRIRAYDNGFRVAREPGQ